MLHYYPISLVFDDYFNLLIFVKVDRYNLMNVSEKTLVDYGYENVLYYTVLFGTAHSTFIRNHCEMLRLEAFQNFFS